MWEGTENGEAESRCVEWPTGASKPDGLFLRGSSKVRRLRRNLGTALTEYNTMVAARSSSLSGLC